MATRDTPVSIARLRAVRPVILGLKRPLVVLSLGVFPCLLSQPFTPPRILAATAIPVFTMHRGGKISMRLVGTDAAAGYVIPGQFGERVAPAVAAAVAALARADGVARR